MDRGPAEPGLADQFVHPDLVYAAREAAHRVLDVNLFGGWRMTNALPPRHTGSPRRA